ncbi:Uncharacterised protein [uncultured archaeon]|nr:Uncharacterised protein [uncultured archaeon]
MAFRRPQSTGTMLGPGCPSRGSMPMDLVTTPPAPACAARRRDAPVVPSMPAASITGLCKVRPPTSTERDGMNGKMQRENKRIGPKPNYI